MIFNFKGYNLKIFSIYSIHIYHSVGRISVYIIYAIIGFFLGSLNIIGKIQKYQIKIFLLSPVFFYILKEYNQLYLLFPKMNFFFHNLLIIFLFIYFASLPLNLIMNKNSILFFRRITGLTGGIYYIHLYIFICFSRFSTVIRNQNLRSCLIIYILCYLISLFFSNVFKKSKLKYLFI